MNDPTNPRVLDADNPPTTIAGVIDTVVTARRSLQGSVTVSALLINAEDRLRDIATTLSEQCEALGLLALSMETDMRVEASSLLAEAARVRDAIGVAR